MHDVMVEYSCPEESLVRTPTTQTQSRGGEKLVAAAVLNSLLPSPPLE